jgi:hypothetical protein
VRQPEPDDVLDIGVVVETLTVRSCAQTLSARSWVDIGCQVPTLNRFLCHVLSLVVLAGMSIG